MNDLVECWREAFKKIAPSNIHHIVDQFTLIHLILIYLSIFLGTVMILYFYFHS